MSTRTARAAARGDDPVPAKAAKFVTVGCKMPSGLKLRLYRKRAVEVTYPGGVKRTEERSVPMPDFAVLNGYSAKPGAVPLDRQGKPVLVVGGYALTYNVPAEEFREWMRQNAELKAVKNGLIIVHENREHVMGEAEEHASLRNNHEPLDMNRKLDKESGERVVTDVRVTRAVGNRIQPGERPTG